MTKSNLNLKIQSVIIHTINLKQKWAQSVKNFKSLQQITKRIIEWDYIVILLTLNLVKKLFRYDTDANNAFLESPGYTLQESTIKTSSIWRKFKSHNLEAQLVGY